MKEKANIELTVAEANALIKLIDAAVKSEGLLICKTAIHLDEKIRSAFAEE